MLPENSNAKNFTSYINSGVDPRTGTISYTLEVAEFVSPAFKLNLMYEQTISDHFGFGIGNRLMLTKVYEAERGSFMLELSSGASFFIKDIIENTKTGFYNYYCDDIYLIRKKGFYYIHYIDGRIEKISVLTGLLDSISYLDGKTLNFTWKKIREKVCLTEINNANGSKLIIYYENRLIKSEMSTNDILYYKKLFTLIDFNSKKILSKVNSFTDEILFKYTTLTNGDIYLNELKNELNLLIKITYGNPLNVPKGYPNKPCPVSKITYFDSVTKRTKEISYEYDPKNNYTGYGGYLQHEINSKYDPIADGVRGSFEYYTLETLNILNKKRKVKRTYNKYHFLLKEEFYIQRNSRELKYQVNNYVYASNFDLPISQQPRNFGKVVEKTVVYYKGNQFILREHEIYHHDFFGNLIKKIYTDGRYKECVYYPASGDKTCPVSNNGMTTYIRNIRMFTKEGVLKSSEYFHYSKISNDSLLITISERGLVYRFPSGTPSILWKYKYFDNPNEGDFFGRILKEETYIENKLILSKAYDYRMSLFSYRVSSSTFSGKDRYSESAEYRIVDNKLLSSTSPDSRTLSFKYNDNGEVISKVENYSGLLISSEAYTKNAFSENSLSVVNSEMNNVRVYNSYGFLHKELLKDEENKLVVSAMYVYDEFMNMAKKNLFDTCNNTKVSSLWLYEYDEYQNLIKITYPSGKTDQIISDFIQQTVTTISGKSKETLYYDDKLNVIKKERKRTSGQDDITEIYEYDFFDNLISTSYIDRKLFNHKIENEYDYFNRLIKKTTSSVGHLSVVEKTIYDSNNIENKPIKYLLNDVIIASRTYDGIGRLLTETIQDRVKKYYYANGFNPIRISLNENKSISYEYLFNNAIRLEKSNDINNRFDYKLEDIVLLENDRIKQSNLYDEKHRINVMNLTCAELNISELYFYEYSTKGRILSLNRVNTYKEIYSYNNIGLLKGVAFINDTLKNFESIIHYDPSDQPSILSVDNVSVIITYDDFDREKTRLMKVSNRDIILHTYAYDVYDRKIEIESRYGNKINTENFTYDYMSRLIEYRSVGELSPLDETGKEVKSQKFEYDIYNNIKSILTGYSDNTKRTDRYNYDNHQKQKLINIQNVEENTSTRFEYDLNGNVINDSFASYTYNSLNQLSYCVVHASTSELQRECEYVYDAAKKLVIKKMKNRKEFYIYGDGERVKDILVFDSENKRSSEVMFSYLYNAIIRTSEFFINENNEKTENLLCDYKGTPVCCVEPSGEFTIYRKNTPYGVGVENNV